MQICNKQNTLNLHIILFKEEKGFTILTTGNVKIVKFFGPKASQET